MIFEEEMINKAKRRFLNRVVQLKNDYDHINAGSCFRVLKINHGFEIKSEIILRYSTRSGEKQLRIPLEKSFEILRIIG